MHMTVHQALLIAALVCSILATTGIPSKTWFQWFPASLMFLILAFVFV